MDEIAKLLSELKQRSGLSYAELGKRTYVSSSSLHRYCTGRSAPPNYQLLVGIAQECGATDEELSELLLRWRRREGGARPAEDPPAAPTVRARKAGHPRTRLVAVAVAMLMVFVVTSGTPAGTDVPQITAPAWQAQPVPVAPELFGVTMNSATGTMPAFRVGSVRFWDSQTRWANLQPARDRFDWATLDRLVDGAEKAGLPTLFVLGGTPGWAAPGSPKGAYTDGSRTGAPENLADWDRFVQALASRYRGRLHAYELWVQATHHMYYSGSVERLVEMTARAAKIVRSNDPDATLVCPSMGQLWQPQAREILRRFAELGGYQHCDAAGVKLYQRDAADPPETLVPLLRELDATMHAAGVHPPLWNTGTVYDIPLREPLPPARSTDYAMRFYLAGLYGREFNLRRMYFYNWGSSKLPLVLQAEGSPPTGAALAVETLQRWLTGSRLRGCGQGLAAGLPATVWQCAFLDESDRLRVIRWTHAGTAFTATGPGAESHSRINGTTTAVRPGELVQVTETPSLITHAPHVWPG
ncbi:helix-turn-helix domain-containing protein [Amycolatopsis sp. MtRt-6]|uniref:helix-turn-helix domain-containing protein n=1 Tax=Amycolatopsis sp. MtRt-6 TaxID=2792782 RepID=UPI001A8CBFBE|nr:helix-turn-helix domain-containing protein [Amycolatopsis sp. MtRt-6]